MELLRMLLGSIALGVGAIFGHTSERETHWSDPPNWISETEADEADSGEP